MTFPVPQPPKLATTVIIDYQNMHLCGHHAFPDKISRPAVHNSLLDPLLLAETIIERRNATQKPGYALAKLSKVLVYRGLPHPNYEPDSYARSQAQKKQWERDDRVQVTLRPLKYTIERDAQGKPVPDYLGNHQILNTQEKGVDVLCAIAAVREAADPNVKLVILASHDSDLEPAIETVLGLPKQAKIETVRWFGGTTFQYQIARNNTVVWNTNLDEDAFLSSLDPTTYP